MTNNENEPGDIDIDPQEDFDKEPQSKVSLKDTWDNNPLLKIAAIVLPVVWRLRRNPAFVRRGVPVLSGVVAAAGLYWLLERTVFS